MPLTGIIFTLYVSTYAISVVRRRDDDVEMWVLISKICQFILLFSILYLCRCE